MKLTLEEVWSGDPDEEGKLRIGQMIENDASEDPTAHAEGNEVKRILAEAIDELPERERLVVALYYFEELTLKEIGQVLDVSESRVSQIHTKALLRLRGRLAQGPGEFGFIGDKVRAAAGVSSRLGDQTWAFDSLICRFCSVDPMNKAGRPEPHTGRTSTPHMWPNSKGPISDFVVCGG